MSRAKTERLLNLTIALLATRRSLTREQVRRAVPGYPETDEAFERMFERDKEELRDMGIPVEVVSGDVYFDDEIGYRIDRQAYAVPEVSFTPEEMAVLGLAARAWTHASLAAPATSALLKLSAYGETASPALTAGLEPRLDAGEAAFLPLWQAVRDRASVAFGYRKGDGSAPATRTVDPWGILSRNGRWYLVGLDHDRGAARVFRVSRISGEVRRVSAAGNVVTPEDVDVRAMVAARQRPAQDVLARVLLHGDAGGWLRTQAVETTAHDGHTTVLTLRTDDLASLADHVAGLGATAVVLEPARLRDAVVARLSGALAAARGAARVDAAPDTVGAVGHAPRRSR